MHQIDHRQFGALWSEIATQSERAGGGAFTQVNSTERDGAPIAV